jgi:hypothetical protein
MRIELEPTAPRRRFRFPWEVALLGVACLACCLPLLGAVFAAATGVITAWGAWALGLGPWPALGVGVVVVLGAFACWLRMRRSGTACQTCGQGAGCAC